MFEAIVLADSLNTATGDRLTTLQLTYPRFIHAELLTHRMFSRNTASSRAIPVEKMIEAAVTNPAAPIYWGSNKAGMQAGAEVAEPENAHTAWLHARDAAVAQARSLASLKLHKQIVNRVLEPFLWHTAIVSATEWDNFFKLRLHPDAQPEMQELAKHMIGALDSSEPKPVFPASWHLPLIFPEDQELNLETQRKLSTARCARVSYLTHDGRRDIQADLDLHDRLAASGHWSPFEHVAQPVSESKFIGNFRGFRQYRKQIEGA